MTFKLKSQEGNMLEEILRQYAEHLQAKEDTRFYATVDNMESNNFEYYGSNNDDEGKEEH